MLYQYWIGRTCLTTYEPLCLEFISPLLHHKIRKLTKTCFSNGNWIFLWKFCHHMDLTILTICSVWSACMRHTAISLVYNWNIRKAFLVAVMQYHQELCNCKMFKVNNTVDALFSSVFSFLNFCSIYFIIKLIKTRKRFTAGRKKVAFRFLFGSLVIICVW